RVEIVLRARRDPYNRGYVYLQTVSGNTVSYSTGLEIENETWSTARSGGTGSATVPVGQPAVNNNTTSGPSSGTGGSAAASDKRVQGGEAAPGFSYSQTTTEGGY